MVPLLAIGFRRQNEQLSPEQAVLHSLFGNLFLLGVSEHPRNITITTHHRQSTEERNRTRLSSSLGIATMDLFSLVSPAAGAWDAGGDGGGPRDDGRRPSPSDGDDGGAAWFRALRGGGVPRWSPSTPPRPAAAARRADASPPASLLASPPSSLSSADGGWRGSSDESPPSSPYVTPSSSPSKSDLLSLSPLQQRLSRAKSKRQRMLEERIQIIDAKSKLREQEARQRKEDATLERASKARPVSKHSAVIVASPVVDAASTTTSSAVEAVDAGEAETRTPHFAHAAAHATDGVHKFTNLFTDGVRKCSNWCAQVF